MLAGIGRQTFIESHGKSAPKLDIDLYVNEKYSDKIFQDDLTDINNIYHLIYYEDEAVGYSKIILNTPTTIISSKNVTKLERLYLLKDFYKRKLGRELLYFNVDISKSYDQAGIWLFVWKENERAVSFYKKNGFEIIGSYDFKISTTHSNPNHQMFLKY